MDHWFSVIAAGSELSADSVKEMDDVGFVVIPGPVAPPQLSRLAAAYDAAVERVFDTLEWLERRLSRQRFLLGDNLTEADIRLFTTLIRFDAVYFGHFKCNRRPIVGYPSLWSYTRELYRHPDIQPTVNFQHIKGHYYGSHQWINPSGIIPTGPDLEFDAPSNRTSVHGEQ